MSLRSSVLFVALAITTAVAPRAEARPASEPTTVRTSGLVLGAALSVGGCLGCRGTPWEDLGVGYGGALNLEWRFSRIALGATAQFALFPFDTAMAQLGGQGRLLWFGLTARWIAITTGPWELMLSAAAGPATLTHETEGDRVATLSSLSGAVIGLSPAVERRIGPRLTLGLALQYDLGLWSTGCVEISNIETCADLTDADPRPDAIWLQLHARYQL